MAAEGNDWRRHTIHGKEKKKTEKSKQKPKRKLNPTLNQSANSEFLFLISPCNWPSRKCIMGSGVSVWIEEDFPIPRNVCFKLLGATDRLN